jgi:hypothetical protein
VLSLCYRCAIAVPSLCYRRAIAVLSLCNRFAIALQSLCNRFAIASKSLCNRFAIAAQALCALNIEFLKLKSTTHPHLHTNNTPTTHRQHTDNTPYNRLPYWFLQPEVPKNVITNLTITALEDSIFRVEIQILNSLYEMYETMFLKSTSIIIVGPERAKSYRGKKLHFKPPVESIPAIEPEIPTRKQSLYLSFQRQRMVQQYTFTCILSIDPGRSLSVLCCLSFLHFCIA